MKLQGNLKKAKEILRRYIGDKYDTFFDEKIEECETFAT